MKTILLLTYTISPYQGSEASVSWNYVRSMSATHKLIVIYGVGKADIDKYLQSNQMPNVQFVNIPPFVTKSKNKFVNLYSYNKNYKLWHKEAHRVASEICRDVEIDVIHYLNPIGFKEPGYLWKIKGIPYVWGPIVGVHERQWCMRKCLNMPNIIEAYILRNIFHKSLLRFNTRVKKAVKRSDTVLAATLKTKSQLKEYHNIDAIYLPENGIMAMDTDTPIIYDQSSPLRLIWIGSVGYRKALIILLDALKRTKNTNWTLDVIGIGETSDAMKQYAKENGISDNIIWHGAVPRSNVLELLKSTHLHIISSLGEANTTVIWEAMANGVPTMTLDHCGMADVVCDKCGIKIPINSYDQVVNDMARHIARLIEIPSEIERMSKGVLECSKEFMYENRIALFDEIYESTTKKKQ